MDVLALATARIEPAMGDVDTRHRRGGALAIFCVREIVRFGLQGILRRSCCRRRVTSMRRSAAMARGGSLTTFGGRPESCGSDSRWRRRSWGRRQPAARFGDSWSSEICGHTPRGRHASIAACKWIEARHL
jgi:hypothetical protein